jgi:hypothetical protein
MVCDDECCSTSWVHMCIVHIQIAIQIMFFWTLCTYVLVIVATSKESRSFRASGNGVTRVGGTHFSMSGLQVDCIENALEYSYQLMVGTTMTLRLMLCRC